jgi:predicted DNA-binding transcriptional regulator AlpA
MKTTAQPIPELLRVYTAPEFRQIAPMSPRTYKRRDKEGDLPVKTIIGPGRIGFRGSDIRVWLDARRRISDDAKRLLQEVQSACSRAEATRAVNKFDFNALPDAEREQVECLVADAIAELPA